MRTITHLKSRKVWGHFWRYLVIGSTSAVVDYGVYITLTRLTGWLPDHLVAANTAAFVIANANSFYWNRWWNFGGGKPVRQQYFLFLVVSAAYLGAIQLLFWLLITRLGVFDLLAKAIAVGVALIVYFAVLRQWVFAHKLEAREAV